MCKIKIGVLKKKLVWCKMFFYTEKKIGAKILHCVIFGALEKKMKEVKIK
jgi:hypothetical protein